MKRGTIINADHVRLVTSPTGRKVLVAGIDPGRNEVICQCHTAGFVKSLRDFYAPPRYIPDISQGQNEDGVDLTGICVNCDRHYLECMDKPCEEPGYAYDLHRQYVVTRLFRKILTMDPKNVASVDKVH